MPTILDIGKIRIGHVTNIEHATGCTMILCPDGAVCGMEVRGSASGTFGVDTAGMLHIVPRTHAIVLTGGSASGLESVFGVMQWLEEKGIGFNVGVTKVPIVSGAVVFDLGIGSHDVRPTREWGYQACENASADASALIQGNVGAGTGATVGKVMGIGCAMKGGLGTACVELPNGLLVGAIAVVNAWGDVVDWRTNEIVAGVHNRETKQLQNAIELVKQGIGAGFVGATRRVVPTQNTTIAAVLTNARLEKWQATKLAQLSQNGIVLAVRPSHTMVDGDTVFALSIGDRPADLNALGIAAQQAVTTAILNAVKNAQTLHGIPAVDDIY